MLMRMAAHPLRWALLTELAAGDRRVRELAAATASRRTWSPTIWGCYAGPD